MLFYKLLYLPHHSGQVPPNLIILKALKWQSSTLPGIKEQGEMSKGWKIGVDQKIHVVTKLGGSHLAAILKGATIHAR